ncbi:diacylglycerol kinase family protein [Patescibacteria group bacterium]|nr:diacylglycerol kinase family protein [Patescibacteria group bacterium]
MSFLNPVRLLKSFKYASTGFFELVKTEQNIRIHLILTAIVVVLMFYFRTTILETSVLIISIVIVLLAEIINSVLERIVDIIKPRLTPEARTMKDIMAAMVLMSSFGAVIIGLLIFVPKIIDKIDMV